MLIGSKIKHFKNLPIGDATDIEGSAVTYTNITALKNTSKRHYGIFFITNYDESNESSTDGEKRTLVYNGGDFTDLKWQNLDNWKTLDFSRDEYPLLISKTYDELKTLKDDSKLISGAAYLINDYKTYFRQPITNIDMVGDVEPLVCLATSNNTISMDVKSMVYPQDTILMDFDFNHMRAPNAKGFIIYRSIRNTFTTFYDSRAIKYRRYKPTLSEWDSATTYNLGDWTRIGNTYYVSMQDSNLNLSPDTHPMQWNVLSDVTAYPYILNKTNQFSWLNCDGSEYEDIYTIHDKDQTGTDWWDSAIQDGSVCDIKLPCWNSSNNVFIVNGSIKEVYVGDSKNNTFITTQGLGIDSLQIDYVENCVIDNLIESANIEHLTNSFVDGISHSKLESNIDNARMFSNDVNPILANSTLKGLYQTPNTITIYGGLTDCSLIGISDFSCYSRHTGLIGYNWRNVNIPKNITLKNILFNIPQWYGHNTWSSNTKTIQGVTVSKYYADVLTSPTAEKLWYEKVNANGSVVLESLE